MGTDCIGDVREVSSLLPNLVITVCNGVRVVRDDMLPGGTKRRVIGQFLKENEEYVYAGPAYGYAQMALAYAARDRHASATIFVAKRNKLHARTLEAMKAGAKIVQVPFGYLSNVQSKAREYCEATGAINIPFGFEFPEFEQSLAEVAKTIQPTPSEVWTVAGSGTLSRSLQMAWPDAKFYAVQIGKQARIGNATRLIAKEPFEADAERLPPFPSCSNYDAKAWRFIAGMASEGALFWNVGK
jgi:hypothetical protein